MSEDVRYTLEEAHKEFGQQTNGQVWTLLDKKDRTPAESELMVYAAYASLYHWLQIGTPVHHQRGEWMIGRVHTVLGDGAGALQHTRRCLELTEAHQGLMKDFDIAYAYEGMARANALAGNRAVARQYLEMAQKAGEAIAGAEDKSIFQGDLEGGEWYGLKE